METTDIVDFARRDRTTDGLTDVLITGAQQLIATAVEAEFASYLVQFSDLRTDTGHAAVVRNGHHPARPVQTGNYPVSVRIPKERHQNRDRSSDIPVCPDAALCAPNQDVGGDLAMALSEGHLQRRDGRGPQGSSGF
jgi:hypothetical protein